MTYTADQAIAEYFALDTADLAAVTAEIQAGRSIGDLIAAAGLGASGFVVEAPAASTDNVIQPTGAAVKPLVIKGFAAQSANLTEWQDSAGTNLLLVDGGGNLRAGFITGLANTGSFITLGTTTIVIANRTAIANIALVVRGMAGQTGNLQQWQDSASAIVAQMTVGGGLILTGNMTAVNLTDVSQAGPYISLGATAAVVINRNTVGNVPLVIKGMAGQTGNLQEWQLVSGVGQMVVNAAGLLKWAVAGTVQTTVGAAGAASTLPLAPSKYLKVVGDDGVTYVVPAYLAA